MGCKALNLSKIEANVEPQSDFAVLSIEDSGVGMTAQQVASSTEPFVRFSDRPGSGLGLIPKSILFFLRFGSDYTAKMVPKSTPKPTPRRSKKILKQTPQKHKKVTPTWTTHSLILDVVFDEF